MSEINDEKQITKIQDTNRPPRRAWVMTDVNECENKFIPKELLVDFNDGCNIYIIDAEGNKISPTKNVLSALKRVMNTHMTSSDQHYKASDKIDGFMSKEDKILIEKLEKLRDYIIENPYVEINSFDKITKGFLNTVKYTITGNTLCLEDLCFSYRGYKYVIAGKNIEIGPRHNEYYEEMVYLSISEDLEKIGKEKYTITIEKDNFKNNENNIIVPIFILRRCTNTKFSSNNPFGYLYEDIILDDTEIIPEWYLLMDYNSVIAECKDFLLKKKEPTVKQISNLHFGMNHLPITENTLALVDTMNSKAIDLVSGTYLNKNSTYRLSPTGLALSNSQIKGTNLPISLNDQFTIEFLAMANDKENLFINEHILALNDNSYNEIFAFKVITESLTSNEQNLYLNIGDEDILLLKNLSKDFVMYKIIYYNGSLEIRCNEVLINKIKLNMDLSKVQFFEISSLNIPMCNIRLSKVSLTDEDILSKDIHYNKGYMLPPLIRGCRKLSNNIAYIFNSIRLKYTDIGLTKDEQNIPWHKGDDIVLNKNENEIISGVYNKISANAIITGIKSDNALFVNDITKLSIYDTVKIIKFNKNLFKIFKILDINKKDNSITVIDITNGNLNSISDLNESYIYARVYDSDVNPSIEVTDIHGKIVDVSQFPDENGNVRIQLLENVSSDEIYISYILSTNYNNIIPKFNGIKDVYLDNVLCEELDTSKIPVDRDKLVILDNSLNRVIEPRITEYTKDDRDINIIVKVPLENILVNDNITIIEDSIISTLLDSVNLNIDIANSEDLCIYTAEESINIPKSNVLTNYAFNFTSTDKTIENNNFIIRFKLKGNVKALLLDDLKITLNLKECKSNEKVYRKIGSLKIDDMIIVNTDVDNLYIKTILNTNESTNVLISVYQDIPTIQFNKDDITLDTLEHENYKYLIKMDDKDLIYMCLDDNNASLLELPNKIKLKGSESKC